MRFLVIPVCLALSVAMTASVWAQDDAAPGDDARAKRRAEMREKMLKEFDADGDGKLSEDERNTLREKMRSRFGERRRGENANSDKPKDGKAKADKKAKDGKKAKPGAKARPGRPAGEGRPNPAKLFDRFDADDNGQLSKEEFAKLVAEMRTNRQPRQPGARGDRPGPPGGRRGNVDLDRPQRGPSDRADRPDRPDRPPRPEGRRRQNEEGAPGPGARGRGGRRGPGPGAGGPEGRPQRDPGAFFDRLDGDDDGQISREEYKIFSDRMQAARERMMQMRERGGPGARDGQGARRGGPPGDDRPERRRRPQRPATDKDADAPAKDADTV